MNPPRTLYSSLVLCVASPGCLTLELGIAIPTPSNPSDWIYVKEFVMSLVRRLEIGRGWNAVQVAIVTYRGSSVINIHSNFMA